MLRRKSSSLFLFLMLMAVCFSCKKESKNQDTTGNAKLDRLKLPDGFKAEHLYGPSENGEGSWVSMTFDNKGRLLASDQYGSLYRLVIPPIGSNDSVKIEQVQLELPARPANDTSKVTIGYAQGLLWAFNSLYVMINHKEDDEFSTHSGLYRLQDKDNDDKFETMTLLKELEGYGEHGPHSIVLSPDKKSLYMVAGNYTTTPKMDAYVLPAQYDDDNILPLYTDPFGHAAELKAPGGWIARLDSVGSKWELFSAGYRNTFDIAFNEAGELFAFDSDMEWDFGLPWYRPTRICHVTSGSEFGWRTGTHPWSPSNMDNLPPVLNIGQGSPTNLLFAGNAKFPEKYKRSLLAFDWSFGIIYAVHLKPEGATYTATGEEFLSGSPLPLTDGTIGPDGALYFLTGGRRLESDLYRVYYTGDSATTDIPTVELTEAQQLRRQLEAFHGKQNPEAIDLAWSHLGHPDRFIRYAARVALEHQPVSQWQEKVYAETNPVVLTQAALALARQGNKKSADKLFAALMKVDIGSLSELQQLDLVRAFEVALMRMTPNSAVKKNVAAYLDALYPAKSNLLNRSLSKVLISLDAPGVIDKTMNLLASAKDDEADKTLTSSADLIMRNPQYGLDIANMLSNVPPAQQTYYVTALSNSKNGWTPETRKKYFEWFRKAVTYKGGHSFRGYLDKIRQTALQNVDPKDMEFYDKLSGDSLVNQFGGITIDKEHQPKGPGRNWDVKEATELIGSGLTNRNLENGRNMFAASLCINCHTIGTEGGASGPNLTQLGTRFSAQDMLESIIQPSKTISDQYGSTVFVLKNGGSVVGRLVNTDDSKYYISQNPFAPQILKELPKTDVIQTRVSDVSIMPPGTINRLNEEELKDLLAYLMSGGNKDHEVYGKKAN